MIHHMRTSTIFLVAVLLFFTGQTSAFSQPAAPTIQVLGTASVELKPDEVFISMSIVHVDDKAAKAMLEVQSKMANIVAGLKSNKQIKELNTEHVSLYRNGSYEDKTPSYRAIQSVSFVLTDLSQYDVLLVELLENGINQLGQIEFRSSKMDLEREKLVTRAMANAKAKAQSMAAQYKQSVGKALYISDNTPQQGGDVPVAYKNFAEASNMSSIVAGNLTLEVRVFVTFELK